ncbi:DUF4148 domain-containing protein [Paraburkholderia sp.]|uniref:DUF4148 domain-containing protein n=1 Tax=Paraburkholderia sp. TaxID=1926495 RepID=UPI003D6E6B8D
MKLLAAFALTALSLTFGAEAFAQTPAPLTRAEVRAQLVQAEAQGLLPVRKNDYPPSATTIARNREVYALEHGQNGDTTMQTYGAPAAQPGSASD